MQNVTQTYKPRKQPVMWARGSVESQVEELALQMCRPYQTVLKPEEYRRLAWGIFAVLWNETPGEVVKAMQEIGE